jgi:predicted AAA+ superfamily ATPase
VLRLMAAVIHSLWEKGDRNPLILPGNIPIDDQRVRDELTRYLPVTWRPVIEKDVDGPNSLPFRLDGEIPNLGKFHACRRVARTIYLGSAPTEAAAHRGIEDRRVKLGCVMPGESPAVFGDALRRLAGTATYLYQDGPRVWYSTQPTVTKLADDRAEQLKRDADRVVQELEGRVRADLRSVGDFSRIHALARTGADVPDDFEARLVVLGVDSPYSKESGSAAETAAKAILESRGAGPRIYRNALVFLAVDKARLQDLDEAARRYLAWESIVDEKEALNLDPHQARQAETQKNTADGAVTARLPEAYQWLLVPTQTSAQAPIEWQSIRLNGQDALAVRVSKKLKNDELLVTTFAATRLRMELDRVPLWRGDHVAVKQLAEDFARYLYLPRLKNSAVLEGAIQEGIRLMTWQHDTFAYASGYDDAKQRYRGLQAAMLVSVSTAGEGLLVKSDVAAKQLALETRPSEAGAQPTVTSAPGTPGAPSSTATGVGTVPAVLRRFHGTVALDATRAGRDAGRVAEEVLQHLAGLVGADVDVALEIHAELPNGTPDHVVRTVTENCRTLKFKTFGFEEA